jgi:hypothetical protein
MIPDGFPLGPFLVGEDGRLLFRSKDVRPQFRFAWRGRRFAALLSDGAMELTGVLGQVPSSGADAERRDAAFVLVRALPRCLPAGWSLLLMPDHRLQVRASRPMAWPANATALMQPVVGFLLTLGPVLDLLEENGV